MTIWDSTEHASPGVRRFVRGRLIAVGMLATLIGLALLLEELSWPRFTSCCVFGGCCPGRSLGGISMPKKLTISQAQTLTNFLKRIFQGIVEPLRSDLIAHHMAPEVLRRTNPEAANDPPCREYTQVAHFYATMDS